MASMVPSGERSHIRLVVSRAPVGFSEQEIAAVRCRFDGRALGSRWRGIGALGINVPERLVFFAAAPEGRYFTLTRFDDGVFELAGHAGRVLERGADLERLLTSFEHRCAVH